MKLVHLVSFNTKKYKVVC